MSDAVAPTPDGAVTDLPDVPVAEAAPAETAAAETAPVVDAPDATAPLTQPDPAPAAEMDAPEASPVEAAEPAPPQPEPGPGAPAAAPEAPAAPVVDAAPVPGSSADGGVAPTESAAPPAAPQEEAGPALAELPPPPPEEPLLTPPADEPKPAPAEIAMAEPQGEAPPMTEVVPPEAEPSATPEPTAPDPDPQAETGTALPEIILPDPGLPPATGRLPRIGDAAPPAAEAPVAELAPDSPPVQRFARNFDNPDKKPAFAILLIDTGGAQLDRENLAALPFPVTFLIDPLAPDAAAAEAIYRAAGQEVAMLATGIPEGATAADLEQTFQANAAILTQAVAIADLPTGGFQDNRPLASQVVPVVKAQGRGIVTFDRGLNAANQVALREDVPAALIFRRLDGEGETTPTIRRYLDRAAFKAAQEGRVAVLGETRPETIAALLEWTVEGRAAQVALAPLTAVMGRD